MTQEKVVIYITQGDRLLVFRHTRVPEAGVQVPAGTVRSEEALDTAAFREASEETGLARVDLELRAKLGMDTHQARGTEASPPIRRHFYHLEFIGASPQKWIHFESDPSDGTPGPIEFELTWIQYPDEVPVLAGNQGALLPKLKPAR